MRDVDWGGGTASSGRTGTAAPVQGKIAELGGGSRRRRGRPLSGTNGGSIKLGGVARHGTARLSIGVHDGWPRAESCHRICPVTHRSSLQKIPTPSARHLSRAPEKSKHVPPSRPPGRPCDPLAHRHFTEQPPHRISSGHGEQPLHAASVLGYTCRMSKSHSTECSIGSDPTKNPWRFRGNLEQQLLFFYYMGNIMHI